VRYRDVDRRTYVRYWQKTLPMRCSRSIPAAATQWSSAGGRRPRRWTRRRLTSTCRGTEVENSKRRWDRQLVCLQPMQYTTMTNFLHAPQPVRTGRLLFLERSSSAIQLTWIRVSEWVSEWVGGRVSEWVSEWMVGRVNWLFVWLSDWVTDGIGWLTDWLTVWLIDWLTVWLIDWLTDPPIDWLTVWLTNWWTSFDWQTDLIWLTR